MPLSSYFFGPSQLELILTPNLVLREIRFTALCFAIKDVNDLYEFLTRSVLFLLLCKDASHKLKILLQGDSGSPLMCLDEFQRWKLVGVFSFIAVGCNVPLRPPVFTRITSYLDWIQDKLGKILNTGKCSLKSGASFLL